jgi:SET domain-containing protein
MYANHCFQHKKKGLTVKDSTIPGIGKGLFTEKKIRNGTKIDDYEGESISLKQDEKRDSGYGLIVGEKGKESVIDARKTNSCLARYVNTATGMNGKQNNTELLHVGPLKDKKAAIYASKDIEKGTELFTDYGDKYKIPGKQMKDVARAKQTNKSKKKRKKDKTKFMWPRDRDKKKKKQKKSNDNLFWGWDRKQSKPNKIVVAQKSNQVEIDYVKNYKAKQAQFKISNDKYQKQLEHARKLKKKKAQRR